MINSFNKRDRLFKTCTLMFAGMFLYFIFSFLMMRYEARGYSYKYDFLSIPADRFMDFFYVNQFVSHANPYELNSSYPPFALFLAMIFTYPFSAFYHQSALHARDSVAILSFVLLFITGVFFLYRFIFFKLKIFAYRYSTLKRYIFTTILLFCAPFIFLIDRGNYLIVALIFFCLFAFNYNKNDYKAALYLGVVISLKIYPVLFLLLFLKDKKIKPFILSLLLVFLLSVFPLFLFKGGMIHNLVLFIDNVLFFSKGSISIGTVPSNWFSLSLKSPILLLLLGLQKLPPYHGEIYRGVIESYTTSIIVNNVYLILFFIAIIMLVFIIAKQSILWKKMLAVAVFMITIPTNSFDYNLLYLSPILLAFIIDKKKELYENIYIIFLATLLAPKAYYYLNNSLVGVQSLIDPLILYGLLSFIFYDTIKRKSIEADSSDI